MTSITIQESEQKSLYAELKRFKHGFFVTLHSTCSDNTAAVPLDIRTLERFKSLLDDIRRALGIYCYGNNFRRAGADIRIVGALEVGECGRLHAHLALLSEHECDKPLEAIKQHLKEKICSKYKSVATGESAFHVAVYDKSQLQKLIAYLFKQRLRVRSRFGLDGLI